MSELAIETRGHGARHVVLLHGWAMHGGIFAPLTEALARRHTVHVVDLPGHGYSHASRLPLDPVTCARAIAAAVAQPALWLGWSLGGLVALAGALDCPDEVDALAMVCASPCFEQRPDWPTGMAADVFARFGAELDQHLHATLERFLALEALGSAHAAADTRHMHAALFARPDPDPRVLREGLAVLEHTDWRARLANLTQPSAWIAGARDRLVPPAAMAWSAAQCHGTFTCIEHAGHAPFIGFVDQVLEALNPLLDPAQLRRRA